jgi:two-component system chemotaxis sensor kinase CheA
MVELFDLFRAEGREHVARITELWLAAEQGAVDAEGLEELFRAAHSLKGAASTLGVDNLADVAHALEDVFGAVKRRDVPCDAEAADVVLRGLDVITAILERASPAGEPDVPEAAPVAESIRGWLLDKLTAAGAARPRTAAPEPPVSELPPAESPRPREEVAAPAPRREETLRVPASKIEAVASGFEELWAAKYRTERLAERVGENTSTVRAAARGLSQALTAYERGGEPAEFASRVTAAARTVAALERGLRALDFDFAIANQRTGVDLLAFGDEVNSLRMAPLREMLGGFRRTIRDAATRMGKRVALEVEGEDNELDKAVIEVIKDPLNHILRNAVLHGVEDEATRAGAGKPPEGKVSISTRRAGTRFEITVEDDGGGLDLEGVKRAAVANGVVTAEAAAKMGVAEATRLVFEAGVTTREGASEWGGRGVGLNVVAVNVAALGGDVEVWSAPGEGTRFTLTLPVTLAMTRGMVVTAAGQRFILPSAVIRRVVEVPAAEISVVEGRPTFKFEDRILAVGELAVLLGLAADRGRAGPTYPGLVLNTPTGEAALIVAEMGAESEFLAKSLPAAAGFPPLFTGAHVAGTGEIILILNADALVRAINYGDARWEEAAVAATPERKVRTVLIVDDSLTTRALEKNILEAAGYRVVTAASGEEAMSALAATPCDLAVLDVQMPGMDGFELTRRLRSDAAWRDLPVVLVTSLDTQADVVRGLDAGADAYIRKSQFDQRELLATIGQFL